MYGNKEYRCPFCGEMSSELKKCSRCYKPLTEMWIDASGVECPRCSRDEVQIWIKDSYGSTELKLKCESCGEVPYEP